jgi:hypothetical protein
VDAYVYAVKTLPPPDGPPVQDPGQEMPPEPQPPQQDDARPWSGDAYDEGDETDPAQAFAAFSGENGEEAWLDKAEDGTLTGWVRDETGQVWRYSDPDTWAIDTDDAGMVQTHGGGGSPPADPGTGEVPPGEEGDADGSGMPLEFGGANEAVTDPGAGEDLGQGDGTEDEEDPEEDEEGRKPWE